MGRRDVELTEELLREAPLELLNASEEEVERLLRERMEAVADEHRSLKRALLEGMGEEPGDALRYEIETQLDLAVPLVPAFRNAFEALIEDPPQRETLDRAMNELNTYWREVRPPAVQRFSISTYEPDDLDEPGGGRIDFSYTRWADLQREGYLAWYALEVRPKNVWERLADLLTGIVTYDDPRGVLLCPQCGSLQQRGRSDQVYCSRRCASLAWKREHRDQ